MYPSAAVSGKHHSFNAGAFIVRSCGSGLLMDTWWAMRRPPEWKAVGPIGTSEGYEQHAFDQHLADRTGVLLCSQKQFCEQQLLNDETPFMHFYGQAQWLGKSRIGGWCSAVADAMSMKQRNQLAAFVTYVKDFHSRSMSAVSVMKRKARVVTKKAVVKAMGTPVWYKGKRYPSIRQAARHNKISRKVIERVVKK